MHGGQARPCQHPLVHVLYCTGRSAKARMHQMHQMVQMLQMLQNTVQGACCPWRCIRAHSHLLLLERILGLCAARLALLVLLAHAHLQYRACMHACMHEEARTCTHAAAAHMVAHRSVTWEARQDSVPAGRAARGVRRRLACHASVGPGPRAQRPAPRMRSQRLQPRAGASMHVCRQGTAALTLLSAQQRKGGRGGCGCFPAHRSWRHVRSVRCALWA